MFRLLPIAFIVFFFWLCQTIKPPEYQFNDNNSLQTLATHGYVNYDNYRSTYTMTPYQQAQQMLLEVFGLVKPVKRVRLEPAPNPAKVLNELQQQVNPTDVTEVIGTTADASSEIKDITTSPTPTDATEVSGGLAQNPPDILEQLLKASREVV